MFWTEWFELLDDGMDNGGASVVECKVGKVMRRWLDWVVLQAQEVRFSEKCMNVE